MGVRRAGIGRDRIVRRRIRRTRIRGCGRLRRISRLLLRLPRSRDGQGGYNHHETRPDTRRRVGMHRHRFAVETHQFCPEVAEATRHGLSRTARANEVTLAHRYSPAIMRSPRLAAIASFANSASLEQGGRFKFAPGPTVPLRFSLAENCRRVAISIDTWDMTGYHLYSKILRSGVSRHIGAGGCWRRD